MKLLTTLLILCICTRCISQESNGYDPVIGQPILKYTFKDVRYSDKKTFTTTEAKGKWLILDFWNELCAACVKSFPENDQIYNKYKDKLMFLSVAYTGCMFPHPPSDKSIRALYEKFRTKYGYTFPVAFDSVLYQKFGIGGTGCPYVVIVNPEGKVVTVTSGIKEKNVEALINGQPSHLVPLYRIKPFVKPGVQIDSSQIFLNSLAVGDLGEFGIFPDLPADSSKTANLFRFSGMRLAHLYRYAYFGRGWWDYESLLYVDHEYFPVLEMQDSSAFDRDTRYYYNLKVPGSITKAVVMDYLKNTLHDAFGYEVKIEDRMMPYWRITLVDSLKGSLITKSNKRATKTIKFKGFQAVNVNMFYVIAQLNAYFNLDSEGGAGRPFGRGRPFVDATGLTQNIDLSIEALMEDFDEVKKAFLKKGLKIEEAWKMMKCIVITDSKFKNK